MAVGRTLVKRPTSKAVKAGAISGNEGRCGAEAVKGNSPAGTAQEGLLRRYDSGLGCHLLWGHWDKLASALQPRLQVLRPHGNTGCAMSCSVRVNAPSSNTHTTSYRASPGKEAEAVPPFWSLQCTVGGGGAEPKDREDRVKLNN